jgi:MoxR-like ATPase
MEDIRVRPGPDLGARIRSGVQGHKVLMIQSDPGIGKTYTILQELERLKEEGGIRGYLHLTATKSIQPEDWFANSLSVQTRNGDPKIVLQPAPFLHVVYQDTMNPSGARDPKVQELQNDPANWVVIFVDEITRANAILVDALLEMLENGTFLIEGRKFKLPILFIFAANPPGMDGSCVTISPAFKSRLTELLVLFSADLDVLADRYLPEAFRAAARQFNYPPQLLPPPDKLREVVVIWQLLSGLPLDRPCYANTLESMKRLVADLAALDPVLRRDLEWLGKYVSRGPDARKPIKWLLCAVQEAAGRRRQGQADAQVTDDDFVNTCVAVLAAGYRTEKLNEDRQGKEFVELHRVTFRVVQRVFHSFTLRARIRAEVGPFSLACRVVDRYMAPGGEAAQWQAKERVAALLYRYRRQTDDRDPETAETRWQELVDLVRRWSKVAATPLELAPDAVVDQAVATGWLLKDGSFAASADRELLRELAALPDWNTAGQALVALWREGEEPRPVRPTEFLRDELQHSRYAWEYAPEFLAALRRAPMLVDCLPPLVRYVDALLRPETEDPGRLPPLPQTCHKAVGRLFARIARKTAQPEFAERFWIALEDWPPPTPEDARVAPAQQEELALREVPAGAAAEEAEEFFSEPLLAGGDEWEVSPAGPEQQQPLPQVEVAP